MCLSVSFSCSVRRSEQRSASVRRPVRSHLICAPPWVVNLVLLFACIHKYIFVVCVFLCRRLSVFSVLQGPCPCVILRNRIFGAEPSDLSFSFSSLSCSLVQDPRGPASVSHALANNPDSASPKSAQSLRACPMASHHMHLWLAVGRRSRG